MAAHTWASLEPDGLVWTLQNAERMPAPAKLSVSVFRRCTGHIFLHILPGWTESVSWFPL